MNTITHAFKAAGIKTPTQIERIWTWLKDHQPQSAKAIEVALHLPQASSMLSQMEKRGMVTSKLVYDVRTGRTTKQFNAVGREYELLPLPREAKPGPAPAVTGQPAMNNAAPADKFNLDSLTIAEARALFARLSQMFKGEKV